jgi:hypothetical protein
MGLIIPDYPIRPWNTVAPAYISCCASRVELFQTSQGGLKSVEYHTSSNVEVSFTIITGSNEVTYVGTSNETIEYGVVTGSNEVEYLDEAGNPASCNEDIIVMAMSNVDVVITLTSNEYITSNVTSNMDILITQTSNEFMLPEYGVRCLMSVYPSKEHRIQHPNDVIDRVDIFSNIGCISMMQDVNLFDRIYDELKIKFPNGERDDIIAN